MLVSHQQKNNVNFTSAPIGKAMLFKEIRGIKTPIEVIISKLSQKDTEDCLAIRLIERRWAVNNSSKGLFCDSFLKNHPIPPEFFAIESADAALPLADRILGVMQVGINRMQSPELKYLIAKPTVPEATETLHGIGKTLLGFFIKTAKETDKKEVVIDCIFGRDFYKSALGHAGFYVGNFSGNAFSITSKHFEPYLAYMDRTYASGFLPKKKGGFVSKLMGLLGGNK